MCPSHIRICKEGSTVKQVWWKCATASDHIWQDVHCWVIAYMYVVCTCMHLCMYAFMHVCMLCMYVCMLCVCICMFICNKFWMFCVCVCVCVCGAALLQIRALLWSQVSAAFFDSNEKLYLSLWSLIYACWSYICGAVVKNAFLFVYYSHPTTAYSVCGAKLLHCMAKKWWTEDLYISIRVIYFQWLCPWSGKAKGSHKPVVCGSSGSRYVATYVVELVQAAHRGYDELKTAASNTVEPLYNGHLWGPTFCPL